MSEFIPVVILLLQYVGEKKKEFRVVHLVLFHSLCKRFVKLRFQIVLSGNTRMLPKNNIKPQFGLNSSFGELK